MDWKTILLRILFAAVAGGAIGLNREKISQAAGLRTYMAVTEAAALTAMLGIWLKSSVGDTDAARLPAAFISGLGFLGAGAIWKDGDNTIKGLTTAAGLLASSITGIAIGAGTDIAIDAADCVLMKSNLKDAAAAISRSSSPTVLT